MPAPKTFEIRAEWDGEAGVWWCSNDELPLTTEAPSFERLVARVLEIAPEIAAENGLAAPGDVIELRGDCGTRGVGARHCRRMNAGEFRSRAAPTFDARGLLVCPIL